jgi:photosystem II stability/assembly factor-like uncharacterized protein
MTPKKCKILFTSAVIFSCLFGVCAAFASGGTWKKVFKTHSGSILCMESIDSSDTIYIGTDEGLYVTENLGKNWKKVSSPGGVFSVSGLAVKGDEIIVATKSGLYISKDKVSWKLVPGKKNILGVVIYRTQDGHDVILAWSRNDLFKVVDGKWSRIGPSSFRRKGIGDVVCRKAAIYAASGGNVFKSVDGGKTWREISLVKEHVFSKEIKYDDSVEFTTNGEGEMEEFSVISNIDPHGPVGVTVGTTRGIFTILEENNSYEETSTTGLPSVRLGHVANSAYGIFASTERTVFLYPAGGNAWRTFFKNPRSGTISFLKTHMDSRGRNWLWVAGKKTLYRCNIDFLAHENMERKEVGSFIGKASPEPSVREVHKMAIDYAEVSPEKIKRWRGGARWKAIMPRVSLGFSRSVDDNVEIYKNSTLSYVVRGPEEVDTDWGIDLTWDLSDLIWNDSQTSIDVRSKLMVQLRDEVLEEVTRLYFERKRILAELDEAGFEGEKKLREKRLRIEELTAHIDALTGGKFSDALAE